MEMLHVNNWNEFQTSIKTIGDVGKKDLEISKFQNKFSS